MAYNPPMPKWEFSYVKDTGEIHHKIISAPNKQEARTRAKALCKIMNCTFGDIYTPRFVVVLGGRS